ncbi:MAG: hypothetical protein INF92_16640 [Rhodobacter sp.]|nr:hypothetical protein [Rhodobacter sp.]
MGIAALPAPTDRRAVLGIGPDTDLAAAETVSRDRVRAHHPDQSGGSAAAMTDINAARAAARKEPGS